MLRSLITLFCLTLFVSPSVAQTPPSELSLDQILSGYYKAMGGLANVENLGSIRIKAKIDRPAGVLDAIIIKKKPNKVRITFTSPSGSLVQAYDGDLAWTIPYGKSWIDARVMSEAEARALIRDARIESVLVNWKDRGIKLDYKGIIKMDGLFDCFQIVAVLPDSTVMTFHIDVTTFLERKIITRETKPDGKVIEQVSIPSEYQMHGGLLVAHRVVNRLDGEYDSSIRVEEVNLNPGVLDSYFTFPKRQ